MDVELNKWEIAISGFVGVLRQTESIGKGWKDKVKKLDGFEVHNYGAQGEAAVAKALNIYWGGGINTFKKPDVGGYQVRTSLLKEDAKYPPSLAIRPNDSPDEVFIFVVAKPPLFTLKGWIYGREGPTLGKQANPNGGTPAYFVPIEKLHSMSDLPQIGRTNETLTNT